MLSPPLAARVLVVFLSHATVVTAGTPFFLDPVTRHTNGMPLATSEPHRDADAARGCDREHLGWCGGRYNCPLLGSLFRPNRCQRSPAPVFDDRTPGDLLLIEPPAAPFGNGLETVQMVGLGPAPNLNLATPQGGAPGGPPAGLLGR